MMLIGNSILKNWCIVHAGRMATSVINDSKIMWSNDNLKRKSVCLNQKVFNGVLYLKSNTIYLVLTKKGLSIIPRLLMKQDCCPIHHHKSITPSWTPNLGFNKLLGTFLFLFIGPVYKFWVVSKECNSYASIAVIDSVHRNTCLVRNLVNSCHVSIMAKPV